uniref:Uncharacterized protein n=1 Tax=Hordeum vulgare subsp. vulgare TaxID=112509 RepID=A0A8I6XXV0_HORVV
MARPHRCDEWCLTCRNSPHKIKRVGGYKSLSNIHLPVNCFSLNYDATVLYIIHSDSNFLRLHTLIVYTLC